MQRQGFQVTSSCKLWKHGESRPFEAMMSNAMLQALTCLQLLPDSAAAASEASFIEAVRRLQEYDIGLSPMQCLQVLLSL